MYEIKTNGAKVTETTSESAAYSAMSQEFNKPIARTVEMNSLVKDEKSGWFVRIPIHKLSR